MFKMDFSKLKPRADVGTILIVLFTSAIVGVYLNYHLIYIIPIFLILYILVIAKVILGKWRKTFLISPIQVISTILITTIIIANIFSYYFFSINIKYFPETFNSMIRFNIAFGKMSLISILSLLAYIFSSLFVGNFALRVFKRHTSKLAFAFLSIAMGLSILGTFFFIFASFGYLNLYTAGAVGLISIFINVNKLKIITTKIQVELNIYKILFALTSIIYVSTIIATSLRSFIYGPDGLRAYLSLTRYLAENHALPYTNYLPNAPFFTEILISPAYMIGEITTSIFTLNFLSLLYIVGFYLIAKDYIKSKSDYIILIPIILFPPFIQILAGEYKIDVFFAFFSSAVFYSFYKYIKSNEIKFAYLSAFFMAIAFLVKMTAAFYILPFGAYIGIKILSSKIKTKKKLLQSIIVILLAILPVLPWVILYKIEFPGIGLTGIGLSKYSKESPKNKDIHPCLYEIQAYEEKTYTRNFDKSIISYLKVPFFYLKATGTKAKSFSLLDAGILTISSFFIYISWLVIKRKNMVKDNSLKILGVLSLITLIPWFKMAPIYIWYVAPTLILLTLIAYVSILKNPDEQVRRFLKTITISFFGIYILTLAMIHSIAIYFPTGLSAKEAVSIFKEQKTSQETYLNNAEVAEIVNNDINSKILFTSAATFANVNFFINNYFDRAIYLDYYTQTFSETEVKEIISRFDIKYIVINNIAVDSDMKCLSESQKVAKETVMKLGDVILETSAFTLLEVKGLY
ncbi:hypothetical protein CO058_00050 [candidate division WWE3 bacterium CG_4_9_14_0_2_um_filter_35_11]|uniref:Glycosyltransferase RgtA/B/C/D-like domain-containing protein n=1 Tax=candidate division WWE3 bacterium CG_4_9_14_0_2_um_filter_35_11 TaxID=1975077 RepID=A0A2M8EN21_UNCKA|nr:MAG: hypothetical protein CO058_00050 [candidate division WWE3 bacterium CG_4_9_14_0_2_um_filter_35_11]